MEHFVHVSTHIEKTAGTSLQEFYTRFYGRKNVYIYSSDTDSLICADRLIMRARVNVFVDRFRLLSKQLGLTSLAHTFVLGHLSGHKNNYALDKLPNHCSIIHGHFVADKFDGVVMNPLRTVVLREPLERMLSHYKYWKEAKGITNHRISVPFDDNLSFVEFSSQECLRNFQSSAFGSLELRDFDLVGVTQHLSNFVDKFIKMYPKKMKDFKEEVKRLNTSPQSSADYDRFGIDEHFIKRFKIENEIDYSNYYHALEMNGINVQI